MRPSATPLLLALAAYLSPVVVAVIASAPPAAGRQPSPEEIARLVRQLGAESFEQREQAQKKLAAIGPAAKRQLEVATKDADREIALRAGRLLEALRKEALAQAEVHAVGVYGPRDGKALVEVRRTRKPVILVVCGYNTVAWTVKADKGAEIVQVIASGYHKQIVEGVTAPVSTISYDEGSRSPDGRPFYFYTYDHNAKRFPRLAEGVRQLTGKKITSFQGCYGYHKVAFVIDNDTLPLCPPRAPHKPTEEGKLSKQVGDLIRQLGDDSFDRRKQAQDKLAAIGPPARRQLEQATKGPDPEVKARALALLHEIRKGRESLAEVHLVGLHEKPPGEAVVEVRPTGRPIILVLCAYNPVTWRVKASKDAELLQVYAAGYHAQKVECDAAPVETFSYDERSTSADGKRFYFYTSDHDAETYTNTVAKVRQLTGKKLTSFQGSYRYEGTPFVVPREE